jgi:hypothetical protein
MYNLFFAELAGVGVVENSDLQLVGAPFGPGNPFGGVEPDMTSTLAVYTWVGDLNLDGQVNLTDYFIVDSFYGWFAAGGTFEGLQQFLLDNMGFEYELSQWLLGDVNYDGTVDIFDYLLIDQAFSAQGFIGLDAPRVFGVAPEPGTLAVLAVGAVGMFIARRRRQGR